MTDVVLTPQRPRRLHLPWIPAVLFTPRKAFALIAAENRGVWLTPLLALTITALLLVAVSGPLKLAATQMGVEMPPDFEYWSPEQQAQFQQASQATQSPVFLYVFPALLSLAQVWIGWMLVGGLLHLALTLLGGRGSTTTALNLVAWSALPFAIRDLVRVVAVLASKRLVENAGLAGFAPVGEGWANALIVSILALIDLYLVWHIVLLIIGVRTANGLPVGKATGGVLVTLLIALALQALLGSLSGAFGSLTITRPFFF